MESKYHNALDDFFLSVVQFLAHWEVSKEERNSKQFKRSSETQLEKKPQWWTKLSALKLIFSEKELGSENKTYSCTSFVFLLLSHGLQLKSGQILIFTLLAFWDQFYETWCNCSIKMPLKWKKTIPKIDKYSPLL